jgi:hypothetical protein
MSVCPCDFDAVCCPCSDCAGTALQSGDVVGCGWDIDRKQVCAILAFVFALGTALGCYRSDQLCFCFLLLRSSNQSLLTCELCSGPAHSARRLIQAHLCFCHNQIFYTRNGEFLGVAFTGTPLNLFPGILPTACAFLCRPPIGSRAPA